MIGAIHHIKIDVMMVISPKNVGVELPSSGHALGVAFPSAPKNIASRNAKPSGVATAIKIVASHLMILIFAERQK